MYIVFVAVSVTISLYCQTGKHIRKKSSGRKFHGRRIESSSKLSAPTDMMPTEVKLLLDACLHEYMYALSFQSLVGTF